MASAHTVVVGVLGLSRLDEENFGSHLGVGKSCLCYRFVYPGYDDYVEDHRSLLALHEFESDVVHRDHFLYWGSTTRTYDAKGSSEKVQFEVLEYTVFYQDITEQPFVANKKKVTKVEDHMKMVLNNQTIISPGKISYKNRDLICAPQEYESFVLPPGIGKHKKGFVVVIDVSDSGDSFDNRLRVTERIVETLVAKKHKFIVAATKRDEAYTSSLDKLSELARTRKFTLIECSAKSNLNVNETFEILAAKVLGSKTVQCLQTHVLSYRDAAQKMLSDRDKARRAFRSYLQKRVTLASERLKAIECTEEYKGCAHLHGKFETDKLFAEHALTVRNNEISGYAGVMDNVDMRQEFLEDYVEERTDLSLYSNYLKDLILKICQRCGAGSSPPPSAVPKSPRWKGSIAEQTLVSASNDYNFPPLPDADEHNGDSREGVQPDEDENYAHIDDDAFDKPPDNAEASNRQNEDDGDDGDDGDDDGDDGNYIPMNGDHEDGSESDEYQTPAGEADTIGDDDHDYINTDELPTPSQPPAQETEDQGQQLVAQRRALLMSSMNGAIAVSPLLSGKKPSVESEEVTKSSESPTVVPRKHPVPPPTKPKPPPRTDSLKASEGDDAGVQTIAPEKDDISKQAMSHGSVQQHQPSTPPVQQHQPSTPPVISPVTTPTAGNNPMDNPTEKPLLAQIRKRVEQAKNQSAVAGDTVPVKSPLLPTQPIPSPKPVRHAPPSAIGALPPSLPTLNLAPTRLDQVIDRQATPPHSPEPPSRLPGASFKPNERIEVSVPIPLPTTVQLPRATEKVPPPDLPSQADRVMSSPSPPPLPDRPEDVLLPRTNEQQPPTTGSTSPAPKSIIRKAYEHVFKKPKKPSDSSELSAQALPAEPSLELSSQTYPRKKTFIDIKRRPLPLEPGNLSASNDELSNNEEDLHDYEQVEEGGVAPKWGVRGPPLSANVKRAKSFNASPIDDYENSEERPKPPKASELPPSKAFELPPPKASELQCRSSSATEDEKYEYDYPRVPCPIPPVGKTLPPRSTKPGSLSPSPNHQHASFHTAISVDSYINTNCTQSISNHSDDDIYINWRPEESLSATKPHSHSAEDLSVYMNLPLREPTSPGHPEGNTTSTLPPRPKPRPPVAPRSHGSAASKAGGSVPRVTQDFLSSSLPAHSLSQRTGMKQLPPRNVKRKQVDDSEKS